MLNLKDEANLTRFVSEPLSIDEENDALMQCELNPELWRSVALAFVEHRQMESALADFAKNDDSRTNITQTENSPTHHASNANTPRITKRGTRYFTSSNVLTASLCFALGACLAAIGMLNRMQPMEPRPVVEDVQQQGPVLVYVQQPDSIPVEEATNSAFEVNEFERLLQPLFNSEARELMRQSGLDVEEEISLYYIEGGSGRPYAIPDRKIRFVQFQE